MIVCPVCENQQPSGESCDVCGKQLVPVKALGGPVSTMPDLEVTHHVGPQNVVAAPIEGLEVTSHDGPKQVATERVDGLEHTAVVARNIPVQAEQVADLDRGREIDTGPRTAAPTGAVSCRYCGNVQAPEAGLMCGRCGMRLPRAKVETEAAGPTARKREPVWTRCTRCGAPAKAEAPCGDCGVYVNLPDNA